MATRLGIGLSSIALGAALAAGTPANWDPEALADSRGAFAVTMALSQTEHGDAVISFRELATNETTPKQARRLYAKALELERKGKEEEALRQMKAAVAIAPNFFQAHAALAAGYLRAGKIEEAERHVQISLKLNPDYLPAQEIGGLALFFRGQFRKAADVLGGLVKKAPCRRTVHYFLGRALLRLGDRVKARHHLEMAMTLLRKPPRELQSPGGSAFTSHLSAR